MKQTGYSPAVYRHHTHEHMFKMPNIKQNSKGNGTILHFIEKNSFKHIFDSSNGWHQSAPNIIQSELIQMQNIRVRFNGKLFWIFSGQNFGCIPIVQLVPPSRKYFKRINRQHRHRHTHTHKPFKIKIPGCNDKRKKWVNRRRWRRKLEKTDDSAILKSVKVSHNELIHSILYPTYPLYLLFWLYSKWIEMKATIENKNTFFLKERNKWKEKHENKLVQTV